MIVKNESGVILRSLGSVKRLIDYWVIVDTGSTDGTQKLIKDFMRGIPGELYERPWVNFEHNRNEALHLARKKAKYILFIDADEEFTYANDFIMPALKEEFYVVKHQLPNLEFYRISLINNDPGWFWKGVIHETLSHPNIANMQVKILERLVNIYHTSGGCRSKDPNKCMNDAAILEKALIDNPDHPRYQFYLAQSYFEAGKYDIALKAYEKRASMTDGSKQELFWSLYRIGIIQQFQMNDGPDVYLPSYTRAYVSRPTRVEPLFYIATYFYEQKKFSINYLLLKIAQELLHLPDTHVDFVNVERWMVEWGIDFQLLQSAFNIGRYGEAYKLATNLLAANLMPDENRKNLLEAMPRIERAINTSPLCK